VFNQLGGVKWRLGRYPNGWRSLQPKHEAQRRMLQGERAIARQHHMQSLLNQ